jgi:uncharacterized membrane protein YhaH (DUF805 family)
MFCGKCGAPAQNEQAFCASCGLRFVSQSSSPVAQPVSQQVHFHQIDVGTRCADAAKSMKFIESIEYSYKNYAKFKGRASRSEYWYWQLYTLLGTYALFLLIVYISIFFTQIVGAYERTAVSLGADAIYLFCLSLTIPTLARGVRRLHDIGKSGWNFFFIFIPLVGGIVLLIWLCRDGGPDNEFGPAGE